VLTACASARPAGDIPITMAEGGCRFVVASVIALPVIAAAARAGHIQNRQLRQPRRAARRQAVWYAVLSEGLLTEVLEIDRLDLSGPVMAGVTLGPMGGLVLGLAKGYVLVGWAAGG
jgi:hypothetical protein